MTVPRLPAPSLPVPRPLPRLPAPRLPSAMRKLPTLAVTTEPVASPPRTGPIALSPPPHPNQSRSASGGWDERRHRFSHPTGRRDARHPAALPRRSGAQGRRLPGAGGRDPRAPGGERRRQVDADEDSGRRRAQGRGPDSARWRGGADRRPDRRPRARHRHRLSGDQPGPAPERGREPVHRTTAHRRQAAQVLERLQVPLPLRARVSELTIAQQQMTEIAKALSHRVRVLVLDEPTSALTETEIAELFRVLRDLRAQGVAIIYISHTIEEILELCDRVTVLRDGELVGEREVSTTTADELVRLMVGRPLVEMFPKEPAPMGEELLRVEKLRVRGRQTEVSFSVRAGEVLGFAGLLGAGRTALMRAIIGAIPVESA